jgi:hypothetical protein
MKYWFPVVLLLCLGALLAFILGPLLGEPRSLEKALVRGATVCTIVPLSLFYKLHPTALLPRWKKWTVELLLAAGGISALISILFVAKTMFGQALFSILTTVLFLYIGRRIWLRSKLPKKTVEGLQCVKSSPAGDVYNEGLRLLDQETDPRERKKLAASLKRFKDGWRLM